MLTVLQNQIKELITAKGVQARPNAGADSTSRADTASMREPRGESMEEAIKRGVWGIDTSEEVAVLLSGGVDSSVSLKLCQEQGLKVRAFYLKIWLEDGKNFVFIIFFFLSFIQWRHPCVQCVFGNAYFGACVRACVCVCVCVYLFRLFYLFALNHCGSIIL